MVVIAHRGAGWQKGNTKENTLEAFQLALDQGADGIETDIRVDEDNKLVLYHDRVGQSTKDTTTLEELLDWAPDDFILNLEIKEPKAGPPLPAVIRRYKKRYLITSFWHNIALKVSKRCDVNCGLLMPIRPVFMQPLLQLLPMKLEYIVWDYNVFDATLSIQLDKYKHMVYNCPSEYVGNVDGIISDNLDVHVCSS